MTYKKFRSEVFGGVYADLVVDDKHIYDETAQRIAKTNSSKAGINIDYLSFLILCLNEFFADLEDNLAPIDTTEDLQLKNSKFTENFLKSIHGWSVGVFSDEWEEISRELKWIKKATKTAFPKISELSVVFKGDKYALKINSPAIKLVEQTLREYYEEKHAEQKHLKKILHPNIFFFRVTVQYLYDGVKWSLNNKASKNEIFRYIISIYEELPTLHSPSPNPIALQISQYLEKKDSMPIGLLGTHYRRGKKDNVVKAFENFQESLEF